MHGRTIGAQARRCRVADGKRVWIVDMLTSPIVGPATVSIVPAEIARGDSRAVRRTGAVEAVGASAKVVGLPAATVWVGDTRRVVAEVNGTVQAVAHAVRLARITRR